MLERFAPEPVDDCESLRLSRESSYIYIYIFVYVFIYLNLYIYKKFTSTFLSVLRQSRSTIVNRFASAGSCRWMSSESKMGCRYIQLR